VGGLPGFFVVEATGSVHSFAILRRKGAMSDSTPESTDQPESAEDKPQRRSAPDKMADVVDGISLATDVVPPVVRALTPAYRTGKEPLLPATFATGTDMPGADVFETGVVETPGILEQAGDLLGGVGESVADGIGGFISGLTDL
jgi:hypothetical protein